MRRTSVFSTAKQGDSDVPLPKTSLFISPNTRQLGTEWNGARGKQEHRAGWIPPTVEDGTFHGQEEENRETHDNP